MTVSVVIPSRLQPRYGSDQLFVERAIETIRAQTAKVDLQIIVGVDAGTDEAELSKKLGVQVAVGKEKSLSSAINAASQKIAGEYVAFFEDDDEWLPEHLETSLDALSDADFVSGTQLVVNPDGSVYHINDFPCPNSWVMKREVWDGVGAFNEEYPVHQDNEWLGRLNRSGAKRIHLVEATAPVTIEAADQLRPWLHAILFTAQNIEVMRHSSPWPLIRRLQHDASWMGKIRNGQERDISTVCYQKLMDEFGHIPW